MLMLSTTLLRNTGTCPQLGCIRVDVRLLIRLHYWRQCCWLISDGCLG